MKIEEQAMDTIRELATQHKADNYREAAKLREELFVEADLGWLGELKRPISDEAILKRLEDLEAERDDGPLEGFIFTNPDAEALYWAAENVSEFINLGPEE